MQRGERGGGMNAKNHGSCKNVKNLNLKNDLYFLRPKNVHLKMKII